MGSTHSVLPSSMPVFGVSAQAGEALVGAGADVRLVLAPQLEAD